MPSLFYRGTSVEEISQKGYVVLDHDKSHSTTNIVDQPEPMIVYPKFNSQKHSKVGRYLSHTPPLNADYIKNLIFK